MPWGIPATRARAYTIICIGGSSKIEIVIRDMSSITHQVEAHPCRLYRSVGNSIGGRGIVGNVGRKFSTSEIGFSGKL